MQRLPSYFISHGGGPWPYIKAMQAQTRRLAASLQEIPQSLGMTPKAILMISAHWEAKAFTIMTNQNPPMLYDYHGFPENTYQVQYNAPGAPWLVDRLQTLLTAAGLPVVLNASRGFDHGAFVPLFVMYPEANIPTIQLSLQSLLDPAQHIALGRALAPLRDEGILIIGSGLSYHNLRLLGSSGKVPSAQFDHWLQATLLHNYPTERTAQLINWQHAPSARLAHPREDHLIPLMVAVGAAEYETATCCYHEKNLFGGIVASSFKFG
jgi:aromatic ring-opening dioxygenase catalytic subunit (LigB family)